MTRPTRSLINTVKGIAHFTTGVALATCFPYAAELARAGSLLPVLGGVGGLLPDLLDFRFVRYFEHVDTEIDPGPAPDGPSARVAADSVADALIEAMREAYETGRPRRVIAHSVQLGPDLWRRYTISLGQAVPAAAPSGVRVEIGPLVSTSGVSLPGSADDGALAERGLDFDVVAPYGRDYVIDSFSGPTFTFTREGDRLVVTFLDWHHRWTHSLVLAAVLGAAAGTLGTLWAGSAIGLLSGALFWAGFAAHILEDQLGHLGCNLFWPITRRRTPGLGLLHAGEGIPNFLVVWTALALILYNMDRFGGPGYLAPGPYLALAIGLPWLCLGGVHLLRRRTALDQDLQHVAMSATGAERLAETLVSSDD